MRLKDYCRDEMPREKMIQKGPEALADTELLAILLRTGRGGANVVDVARELFVSCGGRLSGLAAMPIDRLCTIPGIGPGKAVAIAAAFELGRRSEKERSSSKTSLTSPKAVCSLMLPVMRYLDHEECWAIFLNKSNRLINKEIISKGGMDATVIDNRVILRKAFEKKASSVILVHNHPSGNAMPSVEDIRQTRLLSQALRTCDLSLLDHLILSDNGYYSFADEELVEFGKKF